MSIATIEPADLSSLPDDELDRLIVATSASLVESWRHTVEQAWRLGQYLAEKKRRLGHGQWLPYIDEHLPFKHDQTNRLMSLGEADSQWIGNLDPGTSVTAAIDVWRAQQAPTRRVLDVPFATLSDDADDDAPLPDELEPWAREKFEEQYAEELRRRRCARIDFFAGWRAALVMLGEYQRYARQISNRLEIQPI